MRRAPASFLSRAKRGRLCIDDSLRLSFAVVRLSAIDFLGNLIAPRSPSASATYAGDSRCRPYMNLTIYQVKLGRSLSLQPSGCIALPCPFRVLARSLQQAASAASYLCWPVHSGVAAWHGIPPGLRANLP